MAFQKHNIMKSRTIRVSLPVLFALAQLTGCSGGQQQNAPKQDNPVQTAQNAEAARQAQDAKQVQELFSALEKAERNSDSKLQIEILQKLVPLLKHDLKQLSTDEDALQKRAKELEVAADKLVAVMKLTYGEDSKQLESAYFWVETAAIANKDMDKRKAAIRSQLKCYANAKDNENNLLYGELLRRYAHSQTTACGEHLDLKLLDDWVKMEEKHKGANSPATLEAKTTYSRNLANAKETDKAIAQLREVIEICNKDSKLDALGNQARGSLGLILKRKGDRAGAKKIFAEQIDYTIKTGQRPLFDEAIGEIGFILYNDKEYAKSAAVYKQGLEIVASKKDFADNNVKFWLDRYEECMGKIGKKAQATAYIKDFLKQAAAAGIPLNRS